MEEKYIARSSAIAARMVGEEMMIMSATDSTFFVLKEAATALWQAADGLTPLAQIVNDSICTRFDVSPMQAEHDAGQFVDEPGGHGIFLVSQQPINSQSGRGEPV